MYDIESSYKVKLNDRYDIDMIPKFECHADMIHVVQKIKFYHTDMIWIWYLSKLPVQIWYRYDTNTLNIDGYDKDISQKIHWCGYDTET